MEYNASFPPNLTLAEINAARVVILRPVIILVSIFIVISVVGNGLICYIFCRNMPKRAQNLFIVSLAVFDLISGAVVMPAEIEDMRQYYTFESAIACKVLRFVNEFTNMASVFMLLVIAVDRYRNILHPFYPQMTITAARVSLLLVIICSLLVSWPAFVLYGIRTVDVGIPNIRGRDCTTEDLFQETMFPVIYNGVQFAGFAATTASLVVLYAKIFRETRRHFRYIRSTTELCLAATGDARPREPSDSLIRKPRNCLRGFYRTGNGQRRKETGQPTETHRGTGQPTEMHRGTGQPTETHRGTGHSPEMYRGTGQSTEIEHRHRGCRQSMEIDERCWGNGYTTEKENQYGWNDMSTEKKNQYGSNDPSIKKKRRYGDDQYTEIRHPCWTATQFVCGVRSQHGATSLAHIAKHNTYQQKLHKCSRRCLKYWTHRQSYRINRVLPSDDCVPICKSLDSDCVKICESVDDDCVQICDTLDDDCVLICDSLDGDCVQICDQLVRSQGNAYEISLCAPTLKSEGFTFDSGLMYLQDTLTCKNKSKLNMVRNCEERRGLQNTNFRNIGFGSINLRDKQTSKYDSNLNVVRHDSGERSLGKETSLSATDVLRSFSCQQMSASNIYCTDTGDRSVKQTLTKVASPSRDCRLASCTAEGVDYAASDSLTLLTKDGVTWNARKVNTDKLSNITCNSERRGSYNSFPFSRASFDWCVDPCLSVRKDRDLLVRIVRDMPEGESRHLTVESEHCLVVEIGPDLFARKHPSTSVETAHDLSARQDQLISEETDYNLSAAEDLDLSVETAHDLSSGEHHFICEETGHGLPIQTDKDLSVGKYPHLSKETREGQYLCTEKDQYLSVRKGQYLSARKVQYLSMGGDSWDLNLPDESSKLSLPLLFHDSCFNGGQSLLLPIFLSKEVIYFLPELSERSMLMADFSTRDESWGSGRKLMSQIATEKLNVTKWLTYVKFTPCENQCSQSLTIENTAGATNIKSSFFSSTSKTSVDTNNKESKMWSFVSKAPVSSINIESSSCSLTNKTTAGASSTRSSSCSLTNKTTAGASSTESSSCSLTNKTTVGASSTESSSCSLTNKTTASASSTESSSCSLTNKITSGSNNIESRFCSLTNKTTIGSNNIESRFCSLTDKTTVGASNSESSSCKLTGGDKLFQKNVPTTTQSLKKYQHGDKTTVTESSETNKYQHENTTSIIQPSKPNKYTNIQLEKIKVKVCKARSNNTWPGKTGLSHICAKNLWIQNILPIAVLKRASNSQSEHCVSISFQSNHNKPLNIVLPPSKHAAPKVYRQLQCLCDRRRLQSRLVPDCSRCDNGRVFSVDPFSEPWWLYEFKPSYFSQNSRDYCKMSIQPAATFDSKSSWQLATEMLAMEPIRFKEQSMHENASETTNATVVTANVSRIEQSKNILPIANTNATAVADTVCSIEQSKNIVLNPDSKCHTQSDSTTHKSTDSNCHSLSSSVKGGRYPHTNLKTTLIAVAVTTIFILSFLPHLCLMLARFLKPSLYDNMSDCGFIFYNIFVRSYLVNSVLNPFIYGWLNRKFRHHCCQILRRVFCCH